jgi:hypothetical protein
LYPHQVPIWQRTGMRFDAIKISSELFHQLRTAEPQLAALIARYREMGERVVIEGVETDKITRSAVTAEPMPYRDFYCAIPCQSHIISVKMARIQARKHCPMQQDNPAAARLPHHISAALSSRPPRHKRRLRMGSAR